MLESILGGCRGHSFVYFSRGCRGRASSGNSDQGPEVATVQTESICRNDSLYVYVGLVKCHEKDIILCHRAMLFKYV